ncbi:MAG: GGDEF domain-containing protein [Pseudomonadota bacterium]|nr:GGDEF domain-containing protein [Pseudomonadota bacterium]
MFLPTSSNPDDIEVLLAASDRSRLAGKHAEGAAQADAALAVPTATPWQRARALSLSAGHLVRLGDMGRAIAQAHRALELAVLPTQAAFQAGLHTVLAMAYHSAALHQQALKHVVDALSLSRESGDREAECWALSRAALMSEALGHAKSRTYGYQALALARDIGQQEVEFAALNNMASTALDLSADPDAAEAFGGVRVMLAEARAHAEEALALALRQGNVHRQAVARSNLGEALLRMGHLQEARQAIRQASEQALQEGYRSLWMTNEVDLCKLDAELGHVGPALERLSTLLAQTAVDLDLSLAMQIRRAFHKLCKAAGLFEQALLHHEHLLILELQQAEQRAGLQARVLIHQLELDEARHRAKRSEADAEHERRRAVELDHQANTDALTGLINRRRVDDLLPRIVERSRTAGIPLAALAIDIDRFKAVNDTFGHAIGDRVLVEVARILRRAVRGSDLAARIGGEEFLVVLVDASAALALEASERIRESIAAHDWGAVQPRLACTISVGLAPYRADVATHAWLAAADAALYSAKHGGRNRVVLAEG